MMQVEKPDVTYSDVGGCKEQIEKLREVVEKPLLQAWLPALPTARCVPVGSRRLTAPPWGVSRPARPFCGTAGALC